MAKISRLKTALSARTTGLVLFDALNGYLHPDDPEKRKFLKDRNVLPNLTRLLKGARNVGMTTFYPSAAHAPDESDTVARLTDTNMDLKSGGSARNPIKPYFYKGSDASAVAPELRPSKTDVMVPKNRWNSFFQTNLELQLRVRGIDTIIIAGGSTDVGIASTLFFARDLDLGIVAVRDCCYSARGPNHDFFFDRVFPRMGRVLGVAETVALMRA